MNNSQENLPVTNTQKGSINGRGYRIVYFNGRKVLEHIAVAESILGKKLPKGAEVHHVNRNRLDNRPENLVICPDIKYHKLLHVRMDALEACGNANYRKCPFCKGYDDTTNMVHNTAARYFYHRECRREYKRSRRCAKQ